MFFGEIIATYANENCLTKGKVDPVKIDPIIMMSSNYCNLGEVIGSPFIEGQKLGK